MTGAESTGLFSAMSSSQSQLCNIGGREVSKRRWVGIGALAICVGIETGFVVADASRWWRLALLPLLYLSILGFMQAHASVCVRNALTGLRNLGEGDERVEVEAERYALRGRGLTLIAQSIAGAVIVTAILILLHF